MKKLIYISYLLIFSFTSFGQSIEINYPNGGETFTASSSQYIIWDDASLPQVKIEYSLDNGGTWNFIANSTSMSGTGLYSWTVPNVLSNNCLIKVTNTANASDFDISDATFSIAAPYINLYYPNYSESFGIGGSEDIQWYAPGVDFINIEYSIDGGSNFTLIASGVDATLGNYTWSPIPNTPSTNCKVRLTQSSNTAISDISDNSFSIETPSLLLYYPTGGETFIINTYEYIQWTSVGVANVKVEYSIDNGSTWMYIGSSSGSQGGYTWDPIPNTPSTNCLVRISDEDNPSINDVSAATFTIGAGVIELYTPNGGAQWTVGTQQQIYWDGFGINEFNIEYSTDSMATWQPIVSYYSGTYYDWTVPNAISTAAFIRVSDASNPSNYDVNDADFEIIDPTIQLSFPNGGETFQSGSNVYYVSYTAFGVSLVRLEYSTDGGNSWVLVEDSVTTWYGYNDYVWNVPNTPSNNCLFRVSDASNNTLSDVSDFPFAIVFGGLPACATNFFPSNMVNSISTNPTLTWANSNSNIVVTGYDLYFGTIPNPPLYATNILNVNYTLTNLNPLTTYYWQIVPNSLNGSAIGCVVNSFTTSPANVYNMDNHTDTLCGGTFYDSGGPFSNYNSNEFYTKTFYPSNPLQVLKFDFTSFSTEPYYDNLYIYNGDTTTAPLIGTYNGTNGPGSIVATNAQGALTFVWSSNPYNVTSTGWEATISCVAQGTQAINLTAPNGGESWIGNTSNLITWTSQNIPNVDLVYSIDSGLTWQSIASNIVNTGSYSWQVPLPASSHCFVKVLSSNNSSVFDISNNQFEIQYVPIYVDLLAPNTAQTFLIGTTTNIFWQSMFVSNVNIDYSVDAGTSWISVVSGLPSVDGSNYYVWTIPNNPSNLCLVRISDASNSAVNDFSQSAFYIVEPYIEVTYPNGGETLNGATYVTLNWTGYLNTNSVKLEYSINNGSSWSVIDSNIYHSNGSYNYYSWFVSNVNSSNCRIRVSQMSNPSVFDESNNVFTINANSANITILQPNGGEILNGGLNYSIQWNASFVSNYFKVQFSNNNGNSWVTLANSISNSGYFNWMVPNQTMSNCLIKITDLTDTTIFDVSDATFSTTQTSPFINNVVPNGGETFNAGNYIPITWTSALVPNVDILFSSDGGNTYSTLVSNLNNINYYNWLAPNIVSSNCLIKVKAAGNSSLFDISDAEFTITTGTPFLTLITPNGGESFIQNTPSHLIKWSGSGIGNSIKIEFSSDAGATWNTIINSFASANNIYYWFTPNIVSTQCLIRITSNSNPTLTDISDAEFAITSSTQLLTVITPNGGEYLNQGYWYNITWSRTNVPLINLYFSDDNGASWNTLLNNVNADSYYWNVPAISSTQCIVKVENAGTGTSISDESNSLFTIGPVLPNANDIVIDSILPIPFCKLDTFFVYYTASGVYNSGNVFYVQLSDSVGNFNNVTLIGQLISTQSSGVIACVVPTTVGNGLSYRIRIQSSNLPATSNDNGFDIVVNSPQFDFAANNLIKYLPDGAVTFFVIPQQSGTSTYEWDFGDGGVSALAQPTHNYNTIGKFNVSCTITDGACVVNVTKNLYIRVEQLFPSSAVNTNTTVDITDVTMLSADTALMTLRDGNCLKSFDGGVTWNVSATGLIAGIDTLLSCDMYPNKWRVTGSNGIMLESTNNGQTWQPMNTGVTQRMYGVATFDDTHSFAVGDSGVIINYDGAMWTQQNTGVSVRFWDVAVDKSTSTPIAYAVGGGGTIFKYDGTTWAPQSSGITASLFGTAVIGQNVVYAVGGVTQGLILKSIDAGLTWNTVLNGVDVSFRSVTGIADTAWACAFDGLVYETRDGGLSWVRYSVGDTYNNNGIIFRTSKGLVAGQGGHGRVFGLQGAPSDTTGLKKYYYAPNQLLMHPNPAADIVTLKGKFNKANFVQFTIKDIEGKTILKTPKQSLLHGELNYDLKISNLSNGVYFVFVDDGIQSFVKKLVIYH